MNKSIRNKLIGTTLAGSLALPFTGCTSIPVNDADIASVVFGLSAIAPNGLTNSQRDAMVLLSNVSGRIGEREHEREIAEISKPEIYVNSYISSEDYSSKNK